MSTRIGFNRQQNSVTSAEFYQEQQLPASILQDLNSAAAETEFEIAANTRRSYKASFDIFCHYCQQHQLNSLPADPRVVVAFIGQQKDIYLDQTESQLSKQTLISRLAAIRFFHIEAGYNSPTEHPMVLRVMRGIGRNQHRDIQDYDQQPIMYDELEMLLSAIEENNSHLQAVRDKAIFQLAFQGGFRRSEIAAIQVSHLTFLRQKLKVRLPYSKANQSGVREWKDLPQDEPFSAYDAIKQWLALTGIDDGHLFRSISRNGLKLRPYFLKQANDPKSKNSGFLNGDDIYRLVKKYSALAGLPTQFFGAHSLRSGCVTQLYENDKDHLYIMARTGHTDPRSLRHYLKPK
ncbi:site-specific integrase [Shewanella marina]|uniref:site-specific integrase n=1 Tax=Shewanella marina TaxID=487319 RepID=UPI00046F44AA|nr:site-specific integrase [Shewanella marina]